MGDAVGRYCSVLDQPQPRSESSRSGKRRFPCVPQVASCATPDSRLFRAQRVGSVAHEDVRLRDQRHTITGVELQFEGILAWTRLGTRLVEVSFRP